MAESRKLEWPRRYGRYLVFEEFARGGMASVHLGRLVADRGFSRVVAVKMLSQDRAASSFYARALEDEARISSRVRHPNVVQALDVVAENGDMLFVMEYVHGVALGQLLDTARASSEPRLPREVTVAVMLDVLAALHAAHEARDETERPLGIVHRDVSPQNVLVGVDGLARLADFGVAKAMRREERTATGAVKGKPAYMSPEQQRGMPLSRQADVYAAGVVLAVSLTGSSLAPAADEPPAGWLRSMIERIDDRALADIVTTATQAQARDRYATAAEMAAALSSANARATAEVVGDCVRDLASDVLERRAELVRRAESEALASVATTPSVEPPPPPLPSTPPPEAAPAQRGRERGVRPYVPVFFVFFGMTIVLAVFALRSQSTAAETTQVHEDAEPIVTAAPVVASAASARPEPPAPIVSAPAVSASAVVTTRAKPTTTRPRATAAEPAPPSAPRPDCDPPFRIDSQGRKHYKPECSQ